MESEAQKRANRRWRRRNKAKDRLYADRAASKRYVNKETNVNRLKVLVKIIKQRISDLES